MSELRYTLPAFLLAAVLSLCADIAQAQLQPASPAVPRQFHYQGCLTDANGNKISGTKSIRFQLVDLDVTPPTVLFDETASSIVVSDGLFEHNIGSINSLPPLIFQKRIGLILTVDGETLAPEIPILPSPVAMVALYADSLKYPVEPGLNCWDINGNGIKDPAEDINADGKWDALDCQGPTGPAGPAGPAGPPGANGTNGKNGINCWDANGNGINDPAEDTNGDGSFDAKDCKGANGANGKNGINCWDTNGNGINDPAEDTNGDGSFDANDCKGPKGDPGPPGGAGGDTLIIKDLIVTGWSQHEGNEHFRRGITVGGEDSARAKLRIDSTGEIYARSLHIIDPRLTGLNDQNRVVEFDSSGSVHRMPERYITINPNDPGKSDTTIITGKGVTAPAIEVVHPVTGEPLFRFDSTGSYHYKREYYITPNPNDPTKFDTTYIRGAGISTPSLEVYDPDHTDSLGALIYPNGEGYFRSLHVVDTNGNPLVSFNRDGTSEHSGVETYNGGLRVLLENGKYMELTPLGIIVPLLNGNFVEISPFDGISVKDPSKPTNPYVSHIDPNGNSLFTGMKNAIVPTEHYGVRKMYVDESTELWFKDRGTGQLKDGIATIDLDPMFLEMTHIDEEHPIIVKITPTADCSGLFVAEKAGDHFVVKELMKGNSNATFDWEVNAKRIKYEDVRMERFDPPLRSRLEDK